MAHEFEIFFNDGVVTASEPNGPPLAQGDLNGVRAFDNLSQLEGVERGFIVRPAKVVFRWGGGWNFLRIFRPSVAFVGMSLRIVNVLELDVASSSFLRGTQQVQVYEGEFQLAWENVIRQGWLRWLARQHQHSRHPDDDVPACRRGGHRWDRRGPDIAPWPAWRQFRCRCDFRLGRTGTPRSAGRAIQRQAPRAPRDLELRSRPDYRRSIAQRCTNSRTAFTSARFSSATKGYSDKKAGDPERCLIHQTEEIQGSRRIALTVGPVGPITPPPTSPPTQQPYITDTSTALEAIHAQFFGVFRNYSSQRPRR